MGSYLNIHLNLFPIYVLLLLLTLSHGRPSAKVREMGELSKSHHRQHQQFKSKWYQLNHLYPLNNINSVSNEYNSVGNGVSHPISQNPQHLTTNSDQQVITIPTTVDKNGNRIIHVEVLKSTGSKDDFAEKNKHGSQKQTRKPQQQHNGPEKNKVSVAQAVAHSPAALLPENQGMILAGMQNGQENVPELAAAQHEADASKQDQLGRNQSSKWYVFPNAQFQTISTAILLNDSKTGGEDEVTVPADMFSVHNAPYMDAAQFADFILEEDAAAVHENNIEAGSQQQLVNFRHNILKSLGHLESVSVETDVIMAPSNVTLDYNDEDSLAKV